MKKIVIDTYEMLHIFQRLEGALNFYPYGLKGLISDYLQHYLSGPPVSRNTDYRDELFVDTVLQMYYDSDQYKLTALNRDDPAVEHMLLILCVGVSAKTRLMVENHETTLRKCSFNCETMVLGPEYLLVESSY